MIGLPFDLPNPEQTMLTAYARRPQQFDAGLRLDPVLGVRQRRTPRGDASAPIFRHDVRVDPWIRGSLLDQRHQRDRSYNHQSDQHGPSPNNVLSVGGWKGCSGVGGTWSRLPKRLLRPGFGLALRVIARRVATQDVGPRQATALQKLRDKAAPRCRVRRYDGCRACRACFQAVYCQQRRSSWICCPPT